MYLVGTWSPVHSDTFAKSETTFYPDGTWKFEGVFNDAARKRGAPKKISGKGTFRCLLNMSIETATEMSPQIMRLPNTQYFSITGIKPDEHISTSLADGVGEKYIRKK